MSAERSPSPPAKRARVNSKAGTPKGPAEELAEVANLIERRRMQNRISQRNYRNKIRVRLEKLEAMFDSQSKDQPSQTTEKEMQDASIPTSVPEVDTIPTMPKTAPTPQFYNKDTEKTGFDNGLDNLDFCLGDNGTDLCQCMHMRTCLSNHFGDRDLSTASTDPSSFQFIDPVNLPDQPPALIQQPTPPAPMIPIIPMMGNPHGDDATSMVRENTQTPSIPSPLTPPMDDPSINPRPSKNQFPPFPFSSPMFPIYPGTPFPNGMQYGAPGAPQQGQCVLVPMMLMNFAPGYMPQGYDRPTMDYIDVGDVHHHHKSNSVHS